MAMRRRNFKIEVPEDNWLSFQSHAFSLGYKWYRVGRELLSYDQYQRFVVFLGMEMFPIKESSYNEEDLRKVSIDEFLKFNRIPTKVILNKSRHV